MAKYSKKAQDKIEKVMHEMKHGTLKSGGSGKKVKSRKQAIAIGISEAREAGAKVPKKRNGKATKKSAKKRSSSSKTGVGNASSIPKKRSSKKKAGKKAATKRSVKKTAKKSVKKTLKRKGSR